MAKVVPAIAGRPSKQSGRRRAPRITLPALSKPPDQNARVSDYVDEYGDALRAYFDCPTEEVLGRGYELGRRALAAGLSLLDTISVHQHASLALHHRGDGFPFLAEALAPFEMAHRGFQEANNALRVLNAALEDQALRLAQLLHDGAGQLLFGMQLALSNLRRDLPAPFVERAEEILGISHALDAQLRTLTRELHPVTLEDLGLVPAIRELATRVMATTELQIAVTSSLTDRLGATIERCLYRVIQEALTNAVKHAGASNIIVVLRVVNHTVMCIIRDDGIGMSQTEVPSIQGTRLGLVSMRERLTAVGGTLTIHSSVGVGTELVIKIAAPADS